MIYYYNYHSFELIYLNAVHRLETPCLSLKYNGTTNCWWPLGFGYYLPNLIRRFQNCLHNTSVTILANTPCKAHLPNNI